MTRRGALAAGLTAVIGVIAGCGGRVARLAAGTSAPQSNPSPTPSSPGAVASTAQTASSPAAIAPASTLAPTEAAFSAGPPAVEIGSGNRSRPEVALTFHGAGDPLLAREILAILRSAAVNVTVLAVGAWLDADRSLAKTIVSDGHELGNHTWSHPTLIDLAEAQASSEITRCRDLLVELTGSPGAHFRQSGSQYSSPLIRRLAGAAGYPVVLSYDLDSLDWTDPPTSAIEANLAHAVSGSIVSMHLGHPGTVAALPSILSGLRRRGLTPVTATRLLS